MKLKIAEAELFEKLKCKSNEAYTALYNSTFPSVKRFIVQNNGSVEDAEDNFQESVIVLFNKIAGPEFALTSSLKTYILAISRNLWLKKLRGLKCISI